VHVIGKKKYKMEIQKLQWDTDFFGYDVGKIEFDSQLESLGSSIK
jgi:hypothetical protein